MPSFPFAAPIRYLRSLVMRIPRILAVTTIAFLVLVVALPSFAVNEFKQGRNAYEAGDYDKAVSWLAAQLREKPKHEDAAELLSIVLPIAYARHKSAAAEAEQQQDWDRATAEYKAIASIVGEIKSLPPVFKRKSKPPELIQYPTLDLSAQQREAVSRAAEAHYAKGISLLEGEGGKEAAAEFVAAQSYVPNYKDSQALAAEAHYRKGTTLRTAKSYKDAAVEFRSVAKYVKDYKDAPGLYQECRAAAIKRVAVMPFENKSGKDQYGAVGEMISGQVLSGAMANDPEFIEFVNRDQLSALLAEKGQKDVGLIDAGSAKTAGQLVGVHAFVLGKVLMINEQFPRDQVSNPQTNSMEWKNYNTGQVDVITANYVIHSRQGSVEVTVALSIVDGNTGSIMNAEQIKSSREDVARWVTFSGDERAIPSQVTSAQTPGGERLLKPAQTMVGEGIEEISGRIVAKLLATFR